VQCDAYDSGIVTRHLDYMNLTTPTQIYKLYHTENRNNDNSNNHNWPSISA